MFAENPTIAGRKSENPGAALFATYGRGDQRDQQSAAEKNIGHAQLKADCLGEVKQRAKSYYADDEAYPDP